MTRLTILLVAIFVANWQSGLAQEFGYSEFRDLLQVGGDVKITEISKAREARRLGESFEDGVENFLKSNELTLQVPFGSTATLNARNLDNGEFNLKLNLGTGREVEVEGRKKKKKIKRVLAPILIILLLKAITLIPLALGVLGIKTWNALQLSFVSFVTSVVLAVWKLCSKFSDHQVAPQIIHEAVHDVHIPHVYHDSHHDHHVVHHDHHHLDHHDDHHHDPWDHHYHRSDESPQQLAYNGYAPETRM